MIKKFLTQFNYTHSQFTLKVFLKRIVNGFNNRFLREPTIFLNKNPKYKQWDIGDYTYGSTYDSPHIVYYGENSQLLIGKFCSIADGVTIFLGGIHRTDWISTYPFSVMFNEATHLLGHPQTRGDVIIGNDVWIGKGATILSGITIGNGAVVANNSVVTKNVRPYSIVAGNPAKEVKLRFDEKTIAKLEEIKWWDWDISKILSNIDTMLNANVELFVSNHGEY